MYPNRAVEVRDLNQCIHWEKGRQNPAHCRAYKSKQCTLTESSETTLIDVASRIPQKELSRAGDQQIPWEVEGAEKGAGCTWVVQTAKEARLLLFPWLNNWLVLLPVHINYVMFCGLLSHCWDQRSSEGMVAFPVSKSSWIVAVWSFAVA